MKAKTYKILGDCIDNGVSCGIQRYLKHMDGMPVDWDQAGDKIAEAIWLEIDQHFVFEELEVGA